MAGRSPDRLHINGMAIICMDRNVECRPWPLSVRGPPPPPSPRAPHGEQPHNVICITHNSRAGLQCSTRPSRPRHLGSGRLPARLASISPLSSPAARAALVSCWPASASSALHCGAACRATRCRRRPPAAEARPPARRRGRRGSSMQLPSATGQGSHGTPAADAPDTGQQTRPRPVR